VTHHNQARPRASGIDEKVAVARVDAAVIAARIEDELPQRQVDLAGRNLMHDSVQELDMMDDITVDAHQRRTEIVIAHAGIEVAHPEVVADVTSCSNKMNKLMKD
jgi:hypothetical protein